MLNVLYTNVAVLHNKMYELLVRATFTTPDRLDISETLGRCWVLDDLLASKGTVSLEKSMLTVEKKVVLL